MLYFISLLFNLFAFSYLKLENHARYNAHHTSFKLLDTVMEGSSSQAPKAPSTDTLNPFRDPQSRNGSIISWESSSSSEHVDAPFPPAPIPAHFPTPPGPPQRTQSSSTDVDAILPTAPIGPLPIVRSLQSSQHDKEYVSKSSTRLALPPPLDNTPAKVRCGRRSILTTKWVFIFLLLSAK
jgi:hypothetical protein